jgi:hypothetical protein
LNVRPQRHRRTEPVLRVQPFEHEQHAVEAT